MTHARARRLRKGLAALALEGLTLCPGPAAAEPIGLALVIGIGHDATVEGSACGLAARAVRDRLSGQGLAVQAMSDPSTGALRSAIDGFAAQIEERPPGIAIVYVCGAAIATADRLFLVPSDAGSGGGVDPGRQGVVPQALLNALAGTGGTLYADLGLTVPAATGTAVDEVGKRLPAGLHLALSVSGRDGTAPIGKRLAGPDFRAEQGWDATTAMLQAGSGPLDGTVQTLLLPPASSGSEPVSPPRDAGGRTIPEPDAAAPITPPPGAGTDAPVRPDAAGFRPGSPSPPARVRTAGAFKEMGESVGKRGGLPDSGRIKRLQAALARNGFGGPVDGRLREPTVAAIRTFQRTLGNPETGVLTQAELVHLLNR